MRKDSKLTDLFLKIPLKNLLNLKIQNSTQNLKKLLQVFTKFVLWGSLRHVCGSNKKTQLWKEMELDDKFLWMKNLSVQMGLNESMALF